MLGIHKLIQAFDDRGNWTEQAYFGVDGQPTPFNGHIALSFKYDLAGKKITTITHYTDGTTQRLD